MSKLLKELKQQLEEKYQRIADLEAKLAESEKEEYKSQMLLSARQAPKEKMLDMVSNTCYQHNPIQLEIEQLKQQLAEKNKLLKQKISKMKSTDFIRMCKECGFMVQAKEIDNQTAIAELEKALNNINHNTNCTNEGCVPYDEIEEIIDQQIKSLKGNA